MSYPISRSQRVRYAATAAVLASTLALAGCGSSSSGDTTGSKSSGDCLKPLPAKLPSGSGSAVSQLPNGLQQNYSGYPNIVAKSPYATFKSTAKKPYTIGYSNSFSGNAWRAAALKTLQNDVAAYQKKGIVSKLIATDSNGDNSVQIQQMRSLIQRHVDLIIAIPGSADALNSAIEQARKAGIPVVTVAAPVTTPAAINVDTNGYLLGKNMAFGLAKILGGKGNIMTVEGLPGTSGSQTIAAGGKAVLSRCPDINVVADFAGQWSESVAKTKMLQALSTHPQKLDGVWQQGSMFMGITQALEQQGRPMTPVTIGNPGQNSLAYWHDNLGKGYKTVGTSNPPTGDMDTSFRVGIRTLEGQGPKIASIVAMPPVITKDSLGQWWQPSYTVNSTGVGVPPKNTWLPDNELDGFFSNPAPQPPTPGR